MKKLYFIDSTPAIAPFMNSNLAKDGIQFKNGFNFLGKSGIKIINNLRIAYISGLDSNYLGEEVYF